MSGTYSGTQTATLTGLPFDTDYSIRIQGVVAAPFQTAVYGDYSAPPHRTRTAPAAVKLVALEVTQGLQNWQGDITLVKGKRTVLRVFLEPTGVDPTPVHVRLTALRGGQTLEGSTHTVNGVRPPAPPGTVPPPGVYFVATGDVIAQRGDLGVSLNFLLPASSSEWVGSTQGARDDFDITYRIEVAEGVICVGARAHGSGCAQTVTFKHIDPASVVVVPLTYNNVTPTDAMIEEQRRRIESLMPIPSLTAHVHTALIVTSGLSSSDLIADIDAESDDDAVVYVGIMRDTSTSSDYRGGTLVDLKTAWWNIRGPVSEQDAGHSRNVGSHEMGHILGWPHAAYRENDELDSGMGELLTVCDPEKSGPRPGTDLAEPEPFPYLDPMPTRLKPADEKSRAALGPLGDPYEEAWGLDTRFVHRTSSGYSPLAVQDPRVVSSLMSACNLGPGTQVRWVDMSFHGKFIESLMGFDWGDAASEPSVREVLVVSGARRVLPGGAAVVSVDPVYTYYTRSRVVEPQAGDYRLELLDGAGQVLRAVPFAAGAAASQTPEGAADGVEESWRVAVKDPPQYSSLRIVRDSETVAQIATSPSAPSVSVTSPTAGQSFTGAAVEVAWAASDADGDDLSYRVYYSTDGGADYKPVAAGVTATSVTLDRSRLRGSDQARIRVIATDGTRSTAAQSPVFSVAANAPRVMVHSPQPQQAFAGYDTLVLDASALDSEDGLVAGSAISWSSDIDGPIAESAVALVRTGQLTAGIHVLTATATDSDNMTASAAVAVIVREHNRPPAAVDDSAHARAGAEAAIGVLDNDYDPDGDVAPRSLAVAVPPSQGAGRVSRDVPGSAAVAYLGASGGYDVLVYQVCDRLWQCDTAEATIVVLDDY